MKKTLLIWLFFLSTGIIIGQGTFSKIQTVPGNWHDFEADNLGNLYLMKEDMQIKKLNAALDSVGVFNEVRNYGTLFAMDASNPLRLILWYKDFGTLVLLDRFLNRRTIIDLRKTGILQCNAIAQSYDNNIWIYDDLDSKLKKIDEEGTVLLESADFRILFEDPPSPFRLEDFNKRLYAYDSTRGLVVMDYFGAYQQIFSYKGWRYVQGFGKGLLAVNGAHLTYVPPDGINTISIPIPAEMQPFRKIRVQAGKLYHLGPEGTITIYQMPENLPGR